MLTSAKTIAFQIDGELFSLPKELGAIARAVEDSTSILSLKPGWDDGKAQPIQRETWQQANGFLLRYAVRIYNLFSLVLPVPDINPCPNGSMDLSWRTKSARMLVNVRMENGEMLAFFYGDLYDNKMPIKGNVPAESVEDHLACWMKNVAR